jgi:hypothetical protein
MCVELCKAWEDGKFSAKYRMWLVIDEVVIVKIEALSTLQGISPSE